LIAATSRKPDQALKPLLKSMGDEPFSCVECLYDTVEILRVKKNQITEFFNPREVDKAENRRVCLVRRVSCVGLQGYLNYLVVPEMRTPFGSQRGIAEIENACASLHPDCISKVCLPAVPPPSNPIPRPPVPVPSPARSFASKPAPPSASAATSCTATTATPGARRARTARPRHGRRR